MIVRDAEHSTVRELLHQRQERLSEHARTALARCLPVLEDALERRGRGGLRALVESTWLRLGGPACVAHRDAGSARLRSLLCAARCAVARGCPARSGELRRETARALRARRSAQRHPRGDHAHSSGQGTGVGRGLSAGLERRPRQDDKRLLYWRLRRRGAQELLLLGPMDAGQLLRTRRPDNNDRSAPTIEAYLRDIAGDCSREELKRLFYVAATRARKRLYLSAAVDTARQPHADSILRLLWPLPGMQQAFAPAALSESATPQETPPPEADSARSACCAACLARFVEPPTPSMPPPLQWHAPQAEASGEQHRFEWVGELLPRVGVVAHSFLQRIALDGLPLWDAARLSAARPSIAAALLRAGVLPSELEQGITRVSEALRRTLEDERGRWLLSPHQEHCCELAVSAVIDGELQHVRIDRTFIEDGTRWLIDYKITEQLGGDPLRFVQMQVEKYRPDIERYVSRAARL